MTAVLGVHEERLILDTLVDAVGDRHLLVVLDNAEHVLGAAPSWPTPCCDPARRRICWSRAGNRSALAESTSSGLPRRPCRPPIWPPPGSLAAFESVQLSADRAAMYRQGFALDADRVEVAGDVLLDSGFLAQGEAWLSNAQLGGVMARSCRVLPAGWRAPRRAGRAAVPGSPLGCRRGGAAGPGRSLSRRPPRLRRLPGRVSSTSASV
jgi:hypothetical protein